MSRERFEAWARGKGYNVVRTRDDGEYFEAPTVDAWAVWQAAIQDGAGAPLCSWSEDILVDGADHTTRDCQEPATIGLCQAHLDRWREETQQEGARIATRSHAARLEPATVATAAEKAGSYFGDTHEVRMEWARRFLAALDKKENTDGA
jgi:hypothetical protein